MLFILTRTYFIETILNFCIDITGKIMLRCFGKKELSKRLSSKFQSPGDNFSSFFLFIYSKSLKFNMSVHGANAKYGLN